MQVLNFTSQCISIELVISFKIAFCDFSVKKHSIFFSFKIFFAKDLTNLLFRSIDWIISPHVTFPQDPNGFLF